jgi:hypothetical protein
MRLNLSTFLDEIENELININHLSKPNIKNFTKSKTYLEQKACEINKWLRNHEFETESEEIYFFKNIKSQLLSKIMVSKFQIDTLLNLPHSKNAIPDYYKKLIQKHSQIPKKLNYFYKYHRKESTHRDQEYYLRKNNIINNHDQYQFLFFDERITTKMEYTLSELLAKEQIIQYLETELDKIENPIQNQLLLESGLQWTGTNLDFIELIYGLHSNKVINSGNKEVKEIAKTFCLAFNMDIEEQIYRYFIDIKRRKTNKTRFIDSMAENLNKVLELQ